MFSDLDDPISKLIKGRIDYTKAQATPTICFGCTNHCGVIGWVQDRRVRKIEGTPLDPNSQENLCSKAQGMISKNESLNLEKNKRSFALPLNYPI